MCQRHDHNLPEIITHSGSVHCTVEPKQQGKTRKGNGLNGAPIPEPAGALEVIPAPPCIARAKESSDLSSPQFFRGLPFLLGLGAVLVLYSTVHQDALSFVMVPGQATSSPAGPYGIKNTMEAPLSLRKQ